MQAKNSTQSSLQSGKFEFSEIDRMAEFVADWDSDWKQLDRGPLKASIFQAGNAKAQIHQIAFSRRFLQRGSPPRGMRTFGLLGEDIGEIDWCRDRPTPDHLLIFNPESDYESLSRPGFNANTLSIDDIHFYEIASIIGVPLNSELLTSGTVAIRVDGKRVDHLRRRVCALFRFLVKPLEAGPQDWALNELNFEIPALLIHTLASSTVNDKPPPVSIRARAARAARDYINTRADQQPTIPEICRSVGVSLRTLNYAFRETYEMTAKEYLQAIRLNSARRDLFQAEPGTSITDVANRWGFWHMGQFAADYRRHFAELPSETCQRIK